MTEMLEIQQALQAGLAQSLPELPLVWYDLPGGLRGLFLDQDPAMKPLSPERVETVMEAPPFWSLLWPSGERLCRILALEKDLVRNLSVLDFGCGCGLVACAAARAGAREVMAVDCDPLAAQASQLHRLANRADAVKVEQRWKEADFDLFLAADFLYDLSHLPLFERIAARATEVLVVDSRLERLPVDGFEYLGDSSGRAVPDLEHTCRTREFGQLRFWYRGKRLELWRVALAQTESGAR